MQTPCSHVYIRNQTVVLDKRTSLHYIKEHNFLLLLSAFKWKDKSAGEEPGCCRLSPGLAAFPLFSETIDKRLVQTRLPEFIYCTLLNFPLLSSLNKEALHSKPLSLPQSNTLTFCSSAAIEERFPSPKSSCRISVADCGSRGITLSLHAAPWFSLGQFGCKATWISTEHAHHLASQPFRKAHFRALREQGETFSGGRSR